MVAKLLYFLMYKLAFAKNLNNLPTATKYLPIYKFKVLKPFPWYAS